MVFDVDAVAFDKDGTLIDLDAAWGSAALAWVTTAASGDAVLEETLAARLGLDLATGHLVGAGCCCGYGRAVVRDDPQGPL